MHRAGKLRSVCSFGILACTCTCTGQSWSSELVFDVRVKLERAHDVFKVTIQNSPNESVVVSTPIVEWRPGVGGIQFKVWNSVGMEVPECVMMDYPSGFQKQLALKSSERIVTLFEEDSVRSKFCLASGKYFLQAVFRNEFGGEKISRDVISNPIEINVDADQASGLVD